MSKSGRVRLGELRRAYRLIHNVRDVGHDPSAWPRVLAEGAAPLIGAQVMIVGRIEIAPCRPPRNIHLADCGWSSSQDRDCWHRRNVVEQDYRGLETFHRFLAVLSGLTTRSREQLVGDAEWYRSFEFNEIHRSFGQDDLMASASRSRVKDGQSLFALMTLRPLGAPRFTPRERRLFRLLHVDLNLHVGKSLVLDPGGPIADLPPRLRRMLACLMDGDSECQAALRLGLSRHTVHEYVTDLYRRFGVNSRPELMALCRRLNLPTG